MRERMRSSVNQRLFELSNLTPPVDRARAALLTFVADFSEKSTIAVAVQITPSDSLISSTKLAAEVSKQRGEEDVADSFLACHCGSKIISQ